MKQCLRCGNANDSLSIMCVRCGQRLPNPELATPGLQLRVAELSQRYNEMRTYCDKLKKDLISLDEFGDFLKGWETSLQRQAPRNLMIDDEMEEKGEPEPAAILEMDPNYEHFGRGLTVIVKVLEDGDVDHLDRGLAIMWEGNKEILGLIPDDVGQITEDTVKEVSCVLCGARNATTETVCSECGAKLPRAAGNATELAHKPLTGRLEQFKQACSRVLNKKWTLKEFGAFLESMQETLRAKREVYMNALGDYAEFAGEEVEIAKLGMDDFEAAMEELWNYIETKEVTAIERALELVTSGNDRVNKAMAMNRSTRSDLADEFGYV